MSAENFSFDTKIDFILDGGLNGYLKIQDMSLKLSLKSLDVSNNRLKKSCQDFFSFFFLLQFVIVSLALTVMSLHIKFRIYIVDSQKFSERQMIYVIEKNSNIIYIFRKFIQKLF